MADLSPESAELPAVRDRLAAQLQLLDALGEGLAAIEQLQGSYFSERWLQHRALDGVPVD